jgi:beta-lactamase superfamily II metal-dependent hydrolase
MAERPYLVGRLTGRRLRIMLRLHVLQAGYGDCLVLEYGAQAARRYLLIDGGPKHVYRRHLQSVLRGITNDGSGLDLVVLSHVDDDHVCGMLDLMTDLQWQRARGVAETIAIGELWHNTFSQTLGNDIETRLGRLLDRAGPVRSVMPRTGKTSRDISQGDELTRSASNLGLPMNPRFGPTGIITVEQATQPIILENLALRIIGPTRMNLENLREDWLAWLREQEERILVPDLTQTDRAAKDADTSVPNLSSIMILAEADGRKILLTGDGRSDLLLQGLEQAGLLTSEGRLHVNCLKLPHHGSRHNISKDFLQVVTADQYIVSASGKHGHPHKNTLKWIVQTARDQGRDIKIIATNITRSIRELVSECDPAQYGYQLEVMREGDHELVL